MTLTCPKCGYSREIPAERLPASAARVTCPRCAETFAFIPRESPVSNSSAAAGHETPGEASSLRSDKIRGAEPQDPGALHLKDKAGFWLRAVAALIDILLVSLAQTVLGALLSWAAKSALGPGPETTHLLFLTLGLFNLALWQTYKVFFVGYCGQTPGKMALRLQVVHSHGDALGFGRAFVREVIGKFISGLLFGLGFVIVAFDRNKQGFHDRLAATVVIKL